MLRQIHQRAEIGAMCTGARLLSPSAVLLSMLVRVSPPHSCTLRSREFDPL